jgi:hypothetical protein
VQPQGVQECREALHEAQDAHRQGRPESEDDPQDQAAVPGGSF